MDVNSIRMISDIVSGATGPEALKQQVGVAMLTKALDQQKQQASMLYAMLPQSSVTPHLGSSVNTYA